MAARRLGGHFLTSRQRVADLLALGMRDVLIMEDIEGCKWACDLLGKTACFDGKGIVMFRRYITWWPRSAQEAFDLARIGADKRVLGYCMNECEFFGTPGAAGVLEHAQLDVQVARMAAAIGCHYMMGSYPVGNPNILQGDIAWAMRQGYADWWNNGYKQTGIRPVWDQHLYAPSKTHLFDTREYDYDLPIGPTAAYAVTSTMGEAVGRSRPDTDEPNVVYRYHPDAHPTAIASALAGATRHVHIYEQDWYETRPKFYFAQCGWNLKSWGVIVASECPLDVGGSGGLSGNGLSASDVVALCRQFRVVLARPVTDEFGNTCPMPVESCEIFQVADESNDKGHWGSYSGWPFRNELSAVWHEV
jgi:hypothetical protein